MMGKTHRLVGITTVGLLGLVDPTVHIFGTTVYPLIGIIVADCASKIADADLATTQYGHKYPLLSKIFSHRGFTHTTLIVLLQLLLLYAVCTGSFDNTVELIMLFILVNSSIVASIGIKVLQHNKDLRKVIMLSPVFIFGIVALINYFRQDITHLLLTSTMFGFIIAYGSHILADLCNKKGVPLLFPLSKKKFHIMSVKTNTGEETVFAFCYVILAGVLFYVIKNGLVPSF